MKIQKEAKPRNSWETGDVNKIALDLRDILNTYLDQSLFSMANDVKERKGAVGKLEEGVFEDERMDLVSLEEKNK